MKTTIAILLGLVLAGSAQLASAQGPGRRGQAAPPRYGAQDFPPPIAAAFDMDNNGVLTAEEINAAASQLLKLDKNQDGQLTAEEVCPALQQGGQQCPFGRGQGQGCGRGPGAQAQGRTPVLIALFDADQDGVLSGAEIASAPQVLRALDKNNDTQLTPDEIRPLPGCGNGGPGRGHRWGRQ